MTNRVRSNPVTTWIILWLFTIASCLLLSLCWVSQMAAQAPAATGAGQQDQARLNELRQQRDALQRNLGQQQTTVRRLLDEEKGLLAQQAQLQDAIGQVERELKLPQLPAEYQTKKCKLRDLRNTQKQTEEEISRKKQQRQEAERQATQLQNQMSQLQQQTSQTQQQMQQREAQERENQDRLQERIDPMDQRMRRAADPLGGLSGTVAPLTAVATSPSSSASSAPPQLFLTRTVGATGIIGVPAGSFGVMLTFIEGAIPVADMTSATRIVVTANIIANTTNQTFTFGVGGPPAPQPNSNAGSAVFPANAVGTLTTDLTPGAPDWALPPDRDRFYLFYPVPPGAGAGNIDFASVTVQLYR